MPQVCLVVPCFNEARRLDGEAFLRFLAEDSRATVFFVNDGSTDATANLLDSLRARQPDRVRVVTLPGNGGKAEAVRQGMRLAAESGTAPLIGYWDADLSTPLSELPALLAAFDHARCQLAMGSRLKRLGSNIERRAVRHVLGRVFATAASVTLGMPVYDSQCGAKIFRAPIVEWLFAEPFTSPWLFDVEILARMRDHLGRAEALGAVVEVPLSTWRDVDGSKMRARHMAAAPLGLLKIHWRYRTGR